MKKVLILVLSHDSYPYNELRKVGLKTWDNIENEFTKTIYYVGRNYLHFGILTDNILELPVPDVLQNVCKKTREAFAYVLHPDFGGEWDYILRVNSSIYVDKKNLIEYVQTLPDSIIQGLLAPYGDGYFVWGPGYIISRDIVKKSLESDWDYSLMDDTGLSVHLSKLGVELNGQGRMVTIHRKDNKDEFLVYNYAGERAIESIADFPIEGQFLYRVKQDHDRKLDFQILREIHAQVLKRDLQ